MSRFTFSLFIDLFTDYEIGTVQLPDIINCKHFNFDIIFTKSVKKNIVKHSLTFHDTY